MNIRFIFFNERRAQRGADAAQFEVVNDHGQVQLLWMSKSDIDNNIKEIGIHPELLRGLQFYQKSAA